MKQVIHYLKIMYRFGKLGVLPKALQEDFMIFDMAFCLLSIEEQKILLYLYVDKVGNYAKCADDYGISIYKVYRLRKSALEQLAMLLGYK